MECLIYLREMIETYFDEGEDNITFNHIIGFLLCLQIINYDYVDLLELWSDKETEKVLEKVNQLIEKEENNGN